jgi:hypothetical protein
MPCLGLLPGSHCPHYDGEPERRPAYRRLVASGDIEPGIACDDGAAVHFTGREPLRAVASRPAARAYRLERIESEARETPLETTVL